MPESDENISSPQPKRRKFLKILVVFLLAAAIVLLAGFLFIYACNNFSLTSGRTFSRDLDTAIDKARSWVELHRYQILNKSNVALIRMLQDVNDMNPDPLYSGIVDSFMAGPVHPDWWKRLLDPNHPVTDLFLTA